MIEQMTGVLIKPGELIRKHLVIDMPENGRIGIEGPFDGSVTGYYLEMPYTGDLFNAKTKGSVFKAKIALNTCDGKHMMVPLKAALT